MAFRINLMAYCGHFRLRLSDLESHHDSPQETAIFCTLELKRNKGFGGNDSAYLSAQRGDEMA